MAHGPTLIPQARPVNDLYGLAAEPMDPGFVKWYNPFRHLGRIAAPVTNALTAPSPEGAWSG